MSRETQATVVLRAAQDHGRYDRVVGEMIEHRRLQAAVAMLKAPPPVARQVHATIVRRPQDPSIAGPPGRATTGHGPLVRRRERQRHLVDVNRRNMVADVVERPATIRASPQVNLAQHQDVWIAWVHGQGQVVVNLVSHRDGCPRGERADRAPRVPPIRGAEYAL